jgi:hypothetical protein
MEPAQVAPGSHHGVMDASPHGIGGGIGPSQKGPRHVTFFVEVDDLATLQNRAHAADESISTSEIIFSRIGAFRQPRPLRPESGKACNGKGEGSGVLRDQASRRIGHQQKQNPPLRAGKGL